MAYSVIAATGHRPQFCGGYSEEAHNRRVALATAVLLRLKPDHFISGMAEGWDQATAQACVDLSIPWTAAVPFEGQESRWSPESQAYYWELRTKATKVEIICPEFSRAAYHIRDRWMVDNADSVLALWNGLPKGGTYATIKYAEKQGKLVTNVWSSWEKYNRL